MTVQSNLMVMVTTGLVGSFGTAALAGYGLASRLDYLLVPFLFALGTSSVTMVGVHYGAGQVARAERVAWISVAIGAGLTQVVGLLVALRPGAWMGLFTGDPAVLATGGAYLRIAGPFYGCVGAGLLMFFASQGAGRMRWPFLGSLLRFAVVVGGGWLAVGILRAGSVRRRRGVDSRIRGRERSRGEAGRLEAVTRPSPPPPNTAMARLSATTGVGRSCESRS
jgi:Na+-driven multidrug efflux pump